ncbi:NH(3)-dependent NAD(+) synthetase [Archaeoglobus sulfaticallidus PM70-1]|uniref:NH(3)-dependent NAD(+) synthetase n=1 Tax=Archaeoglobus sulfaticallidus PM70-1 TaxID=387631 RepID=N0BI43_9EURY|nr:NAD+ synthase [Archaeoglobus sulfaticallidus]AGK61962.1 NH(3)-dependent NAD(+) synthetase [Archaeoglobus sulfaticallidus PM70-1]
MGMSMEKVEKRIVEFIRDYVRSANAEGVVLGVSGGVDSACVAFLCSKALGGENVLGLIMPEKGVTREEDVEDAIEVCKKAGIKYKIVEISDILQKFKGISSCDRDIALANLKPRIRMVLNYYYANCLNRIVAGTGNKSELMVGYFTKYGDGGCDFLPIGDLYKTEVFMLAEHLGVPERVIKKKPSAGLWVGQTDEDEMGISYKVLDAILKRIERGEIEKAIEEFGKDSVDKVRDMIARSEHKRSLPMAVSLRDLLD